MDKINNIFDSRVELVGDNYSSVFTKDDVVNLINNLRTDVLIAINEIKTTAYISEMDFQEFSSSVSKKLERALNDGTLDVVDNDSAEFTIGYRNTIEIECINVDTDAITDELANILLDEFQVKFGRFINPETED